VGRASGFEMGYPDPIPSPIPISPLSLDSYCDIRDLGQERMTSKRLRLPDSGYRNGLAMGVGSCFIPFET